MGRRVLVSVIGDGRVAPGSDRYEAARLVGRLIIDQGHRLVTGGLGGVMEAACRGAHESERYREGDTIGILPGFSEHEANAWVDVPIVTGLDHLRNAIVANSAAVIVVGGASGTLSEMAFAWLRDRPVIALPLGGWGGRLAGQPLDAKRHDAGQLYSEVLAARDPQHALELVAQAIAAPHPTYAGMFDDRQDV